MDLPEGRVETGLGELEVRPATAEEAQDLLRLREELADWMLQRGIEQWRPGEVSLRWFERRVAEGCVYVVPRDDAVAASVTVRWHDRLVWEEPRDAAGYIHSLMVDRRHAGHRLGRSLVAWAEDHISASGRALAHLDCVRSNGRLCAYYEGAGYRLVGYKDFPDIPWAFETALYEKHLGK